jgi:hypothetical protein
LSYMLYLRKQQKAIRLEKQQIEQMILLKCDKKEFTRGIEELL